MHDRFATVCHILSFPILWSSFIEDLAYSLQDWAQNLKLRFSGDTSEGYFSELYNDSRVYSGELEGFRGVTDQAKVSACFSTVSLLLISLIRTHGNCTNMIDFMIQPENRSLLQASLGPTLPEGNASFHIEFTYWAHEYFKKERMGQPCLHTCIQFQDQVSHSSILASHGYLLDSIYSNPTLIQVKSACRDGYHTICSQTLLTKIFGCWCILTTPRWRQRSQIVPNSNLRQSCPKIYSQCNLQQIHLPHWGWKLALLAILSV